MKKINLLGIAIIAFLCIGVVDVNASDTPHIDSKLTDGKLIIKSILPSSISDVNMQNEALYDAFASAVGQTIHEGDYSYYNCNSDFTSCTVYYKRGQSDQESKVVTFEYSYDTRVKTIIDEYLEELNDGKSSFIVTDLEMINYWVNNSENTTLLSFSEEYKSYFGYKNFIPYIDVRGGGGSGIFTDSNIGMAKLKYNDTLYFIKDGFGAFTRNIIYIPTDTTNENVLTAVRSRIEAYIGDNDTVTIEQSNTIEQYIEDYIEEAQELDALDFAQFGYDNDYYENALATINNTDGALHFLLDDNIAPNYFKIIVNGNMDTPYYFVVIKDSSKMQTPKFKTSDVSTNISISSSNYNIPLDTLIKVNKIASGEEYDRIMEILDVANSEMFDLNLFSKSMNTYLTELEDGTFEVRIPISENYRGKNLIVYYVDEDNNNSVQEYEVTIDGDYAVFNTSHFSVYTLVATNNTNPNTGDGIISYIFLGSILLVGFLVTSIYLKKKRFN